MEDLDIRLADVTTSVAENGEVTTVLGRTETGKGITRGVVYGSGPAFVSQPNDPSEDGACRALYMVEGQTVRVFAMSDNRFNSQAGTLANGDAAIVSDCDARFLLKREGNSVTLYTVNEKDDLNSVMVHLNGKDGEILILNGGAKVSLETDRIVLAVNGGGSIVIDENGVTIGGKEFHADCGGGTFGLIGGQRPPPILNSVLYGPNGQIGVASTTWTISP
jgi:hypothetical protein